MSLIRVSLAAGDVVSDQACQTILEKKPRWCGASGKASLLLQLDSERYTCGINHREDVRSFAPADLHSKAIAG